MKAMVSANFYEPLSNEKLVKPLPIYTWTEFSMNLLYWEDMAIAVSEVNGLNPIGERIHFWEIYDVRSHFILFENQSQIYRFQY